jgi:hypothetical protein
MSEWNEEISRIVVGCESSKVSRTNWIVLHHAQRAMCARAGHGLVVAGKGHGDQAHDDGAGFSCSEP